MLCRTFSCNMLSDCHIIEINHKSKNKKRMNEYCVV